MTVYLDYQATTPVDRRVFKAMEPYFSTYFGNPASRTHEYGWRAEAAIEAARGEIAVLIGAETNEILLTSGATESNNLALKGVMLARKNGRSGDHVITTTVEHKSVLGSCESLERAGYSVTYLDVDSNGQPDLTALRAAITERTFLVSVIFANNEIGTINRISEISQICRENEVFFHTDAAQALGTLPIDVHAMNIDLMSLSSHKIYGPKGVGALFVRRRDPRVTLEPQMDGGGQESGLRSGTSNVPAIVGFGKAAAIMRLERDAEAARLRKLRDAIWSTIIRAIPDLRLNGHPVERLPHNLNFVVPNVGAQTLMRGLKGFAFSSASACDSFGPEGSHVLRKIGLDPKMMNSSIRVSVGRMTTQDEADEFAQRFIEVVNEIRGSKHDISPALY